MSEVPEARPSATVVLLRDGEQGPEVLLLLRSAKLSFHGGEWVFPGGRVDEEDLEGGHDPHELVAAKRAARREAMEEAGVELDVDELFPIAHWTTPIVLPKRFATWFLLGEVRSATTVVEVDGGEIEDAMWVRPEEALARRERGEIGLPPPTFVTLTWLAPFATAREAIEAFRTRPPERYFPRVCVADEAIVNVFFGDAAFETGDVTCPGPRHRLTMRKGPWVLERDLP